VDKENATFGDSVNKGLPRNLLALPIPKLERDPRGSHWQPRPFK
jgi:hypothetical protein